MSRSKRSTRRVNYEALEAGLGQPVEFISDENVELNERPNATVQREDDDRNHNLDELRAALAAAQKEHDTLRQKAERQALQQELDDLRAKSQRFRFSACFLTPTTTMRCCHVRDQLQRNRVSNVLESPPR